MINLYTNQYNYYKTYMNLMNRMYTQKMPSNELVSSQNQKSSLYAQSQSMLNTLNSVSKNVTDLKQSSNSLLKDNLTSSLHAREITTSNETSIGASVKNDATIKDYSLQINQIAKSQENKGSQINQNDATTITAGENKFSLTVGSVTKSLSVSILSSDTNEEAMQKVANAMNQSGLEVSAKLAKDSTTSQVQLQVTSKKTGTDHAFSLNDISGNVIAQTGINNITTQAQNAEYLLDGNLKTAQSNVITLDKDKVSLNLKAVTNNVETVSIKPDKKKIITQMKEMIQDYNNLLDTFNNNADILNPSIRRNFSSGLYSYTFDDTGISKTGYDKLKLNEKDLEKQLDSNFSRTINSLDSLADKLHDKSSNLGNMTGEMILQKNTYQPSLQNLNYNPFTAMQSSSFPWYTGWMFDRYY